MPLSARGRPRTSGPRRNTLRPRLILEVPPGLAADRLAAALEGGDVAAVVIPAAAREAKGLVAAAQAAEAAALIAGSGWPAPHGADGLHTDADAIDRIRARPGDASCGAAAGSKHDAMMAGEAGADYLWFDGGGDLVAAADLASWWQRVFEVPAVVAGPCDTAAVAAMIETGAEFVALVNAFGEEDDPREIVARVNAAFDVAGADGTA